MLYIRACYTQIIKGKDLLKKRIEVFLFLDKPSQLHVNIIKNMEICRESLWGKAGSRQSNSYIKNKSSLRQYCYKFIIKSTSFRFLNDY